MAKGSYMKLEAPETSPPLEEIKSPPSPPPSESNSPSPPYSDKFSDSNTEAFPPPPPSDSSPPSPPPPSPLPPPSKSNNNENGTSSPPPPDKSSSGSPPPTSTSPPPSSPSSEQSPFPPASSDSGNSSGEDGGSPPPSVQQSPPTVPVDGGTPPDVAQSGVVPSTNLNPTLPLSPPASGNNQSSSSSRPPVDNEGNGEGPPALPSSTSSSSSYSNSSSSSIPVSIIVGVMVGGLLLLLFAVVMVCLRKKKKEVQLAPPGHYGPTVPQGNQYWQATPQGHTVNIPPQSPVSGYCGDHSGQHSGPNMSSNAGVTPGGYGLGFSSKSTFSYEELAAATNGFNQSNMLGQGGFGYVHKGVLPDGKAVAVKSLKSGSGQGEREFQAEVEIISRVHHRHLVSLVGYCIGRGQRMLVYEFLPNDTLEYHLHKKGDPVLDFPTRLRIALGSAKGLAYLHEDCHPRIIHRDIKASNILLDENFEAMVADFGLAKLTSDTNTHVSTRVMGTFGYLAPEYASSGKLTEKSDVFSFGVMLLELITGRRPVDPKMQYMEDSLVDWSRPLLTKALETNNYDELVDPRLEGNYNSQDIKRMVACAAASIRHSARKRPKMSQIVRVLEGDVSLEDLNEGVKPGQSSVYNSSDGSPEYDSRTYSADLKRFRQIAFAPQDFTSSEYGGSTSEYGLDPSSSSSSDNSREMKS